MPCAGLLPTLSPAGSMERSGSVPSGPLSLGSGPLPSLPEEDFDVSQAVAVCSVQHDSIVSIGFPCANPVEVC